MLLSSDPPDAAIDWQPLVMDARHHPYVDLRCGDQRAQAVWDTGASLTVVDQGFIERHPALFDASRTVERHRRDRHGSGNADVHDGGVQHRTLRLPALRVAGVDLAAVNATIEIPMDAILGYNLLSRADWWFDFPRQRWAIARSVGAIMTAILTNATDAQLAAAVEDNLYAFFRAMLPLPGSDLVETDRLSYHLTFPDGPMFKGIWRARLAPEEADAAITQALDWFQQRHAALTSWWISNATKPRRSGGSAAGARLHQTLCRRSGHGCRSIQLERVAAPGRLEHRPRAGSHHADRLAQRGLRRLRPAPVRDPVVGRCDARLRHRRRAVATLRRLLSRRSGRHQLPVHRRRSRRVVLRGDRASRPAPGLRLGDHAPADARRPRSKAITMPSCSPRRTARSFTSGSASAIPAAASRATSGKTRASCSSAHRLGAASATRRLPDNGRRSRCGHVLRPVGDGSAPK